MAGRLDKVLDDGHMGEEVELLEYHPCGHKDAPYVAGSGIGRGHISLIRPAEALSADRDISAVDGFEAVDAAQESRLARAGGADDGEHLPACEAEIDAAQDGEIAEGLVNAAHGEHDFISFHICHSMPPAF